VLTDSRAIVGKIALTGRIATGMKAGMAGRKKV